MLNVTEMLSRPGSPRPRPDRPRPRPGRPRPRQRPAWSRPRPTPDTETFAVLVTTSTHSFHSSTFEYCTAVNVIMHKNIEIGLSNTKPVKSILKCQLSK